MMNTCFLHLFDGLLAQLDTLISLFVTFDFFQCVNMEDHVLYFNPTWFQKHDWFPGSWQSTGIDRLTGLCINFPFHP